MPAARRRHPRFFGRFWPSVWPSSRSNFDLGPSPLDSTKKNFHIRAYDFGVQFSFKRAGNAFHSPSGAYGVFQPLRRRRWLVNAIETITWHVGEAPLRSLLSRPWAASHWQQETLDLLQNKFRYDFQKNPREISGGTEFTVFTVIKGTASFFRLSGSTWLRNLFIYWYVLQLQSFFFTQSFDQSWADTVTVLSIAAYK